MTLASSQILGPKFDIVCSTRHLTVSVPLIHAALCRRSQHWTPHMFRVHSESTHYSELHRKSQISLLVICLNRYCSCSWTRIVACHCHFKTISCGLASSREAHFQYRYRIKESIVLRVVFLPPLSDFRSLTNTQTPLAMSQPMGTSLAMFLSLTSYTKS